MYPLRKLSFGFSFVLLKGRKATLNDDNFQGRLPLRILRNIDDKAGEISELKTAKPI